MCWRTRNINLTHFEKNQHDWIKAYRFINGQS